MKYGFLEKMMWSGYKNTFKKHLSATLNEPDPKAVMKAAHKKYKEILADVTEFDKDDRFIINILSCAMLASVLLTVKKQIFGRRSPRVLSRRDVRQFFDENGFQKK